MRIVVVDDEPKIRHGITTLLDGRNGWQIVGSYDGAQKALLSIAETRPDIMIVDIKMPEYSGLDLIAKIREHNDEIYMIIVSGYSDFKFAQKAIELGVFRYLTKPTNPRQLIDTITEIEVIMDKTDTAEKLVEDDSNNLLVSKAIDYIRLNYAQKIGLKSIAEQLYITPNYLSELFKKNMDINFATYLSEYRLKKACEFLQQSEYKISEVSDMVGFKDARYFSTIFKKSFDMTPLEYRNRVSK